MMAMTHALVEDSIFEHELYGLSGTLWEFNYHDKPSKQVKLHLQYLQESDEYPNASLYHVMIESLG